MSVGRQGLPRRGGLSRRLFLAGSALLLAAATMAAMGALAGPATSPIPAIKPTRPVPAPPQAPEQHQSGIAGWMVADLDTGEVLDAHQADTAFAPASVAKLPTAFYAIDRLGAAHRFETQLAITGEQRGATLDGDLVLIGGGDPELDTDDLLPLATQFQALGLTRVKGQFLVDGNRAARSDRIDYGQPEDAAYNPSVSGLNLNFNRVRLKWNARNGANELRISAKAVRLDPDVTGVRVQLTDQEGAPMFSHAQEGETEVWRMNRAGYRGKGARWLPVRGPEIYAGEVFQGLARGAGVTLAPAREGQASQDARVVASHESRPLDQMLRGMLRYSTNLTAEAVGIAASRKDRSEVASLADSAKALNDWAAQVTGFAPGDPGFQLANHSGLSTTSRVSPRRMVEFLRMMAVRQPEKGEKHPRLPGGVLDLVKDYNVAAKSVKLDYRNLNVVAKTGTMDYIRGLAGFIATPSGRRLVFAVFSNDLPSRGTRTRRADRRWMAQSRDFERRLIRNWVLRLEG